MSLLLVMVLISALFSACAKKDDTSSSDTTANTEEKSETSETKSTDDSADSSDTSDTVTMGWKENAGDKIDLTWYLNFSWYPNQWGVDATSQYITEKKQGSILSLSYQQVTKLKKNLTQ